MLELSSIASTFTSGKVEFIILTNLTFSDIITALYNIVIIWEKNMPPKKQICKEQIIDKSYEIVRKKGFESLTARLLAKELNCSTQPIYMSFSDMNELKNTLAEKCITFMMQYIENYSIKKYPPLLSRILGYVQFANEEKYLYQLMFSTQIFNLDQVRKLVAGNDELELNMLIYAHGIIMMKAFGTLTIEWEQIQEMIINAYNYFSV